MSDNCIEEIMKAEFEETDSLSSELRETSCILKDVANDIFM